MENYIGDWLNLLLRWLHVITGIAWIGSSFYFVWLDNSLVRPAAQDLKDKGVDGELWAVHGGGFYNPQKYMVAPKQLPEHLHWFYWESYWTWMSGFALFVVLYLFNAQTFLIDKNVFAWDSSAAAIVASLVYLVMGWVVYDGICRAFGQRKNGDLIVGVLVFVYVIAATFIACHLFAGRAAFLLTGAMLATAMSANVLMVIIPGQKKTVAAMKAGQKPDPMHPMRAKQRSVHNTYFTLPVLFAMLSNHYSFTWSHPQNWLVLILMMFAGAAIRQFFVMRHGYKLGRNGNPLPYALVGVAVIVGAIVWMRPAPVAAPAANATVSGAASADKTGASGQNDFKAVQAVLEQRCYMCHGAAVQMKNLRLDSPDSVKQHAQAIYQQAVVQKLMPMNNATGITDAERALIGKWFEAGAPMGP